MSDTHKNKNSSAQSIGHSVPGEGDASLNDGHFLETYYEDEDDSVPIDRGWSWMAVLGCFGMHVVVVGGSKCLGVLAVEIRDKFGDVTASELGLVQGTNITLLLGLGLVANLLASRFTCRAVVFVGGLLSCAGFILTAFIDRFWMIYITYGLITGLGFGLSYTPCITYVNAHFKMRRSLANGLSLSGAGTGAFLLPNLMRFLLRTYGLSGCCLVMAAIELHVCACALLFRPDSSYRTSKRNKLLNGVTVLEKSEKLNNLQDEEQENVPNQETADFVSENKTYKSDKNMTISIQRICDTDITSHLSLNDDITNHLSLNDGDSEKYSAQFHNGWDENTLHSTLHQTLSYQGTNQCDNLETSLCSNPTVEISMDKSLSDYIAKQSECAPVVNHKKRTSLTPSCHIESKAKMESTKKDPPFFEWSLLSNPLFLIYFFFCLVSNVAYPNIYFMLPEHAELNGQNRDNAALLTSFVGLTDLIGRFFMGWFSDLRLFDRRYSFITACMCSGCFSLMVPVFTSFWSMAAYAIGYGFCAGSYISLIAVMTAEAVGLEKFSSALGLVMMAQASSLIPGPILCGKLRDTTGSWNSSFVLLGSLAVIASSLPLLHPYAQRLNARKEAKTAVVHKEDCSVISQ